MAGRAPSQSSVEAADQHAEEQAQTVDSSRIAMPEDGYEWKKYGQKFIRTVQKNRSYFKCRNKSCRVKKRVEWPPSDPSNLRIVYDGVHDHPSLDPKSASEQEATTSSANQYNLATQVFGHPANPS